MSIAQILESVKEFERAFEAQEALLRTRAIQLDMRLERVEKENEELRAKLCVAAIAAAEEVPLPTGFTLTVLPSVSSDEALLNEAYTNTGPPFEGYKYLQLADDEPFRTASGACIRVKYDPAMATGNIRPAMATGHIRLPLFQRLAFGLGLEKAYRFKVVEQPPPLKSCTVKVTPITKEGALPIDVIVHAAQIKRALEGNVAFEGCIIPFRLDRGSYSVYRLTVKSVSPSASGAGILTMDTRIEPAVELLESIA